MTKLVADELEASDVSLGRLKLNSQSTFLAQDILKLVFAERNTVSGRSEYTSGGSYTFVVPAGVIKISALAVGAGGGGAQTWANSAGAGGGLAWADNIDVVEGDTISITVAPKVSSNNNGGTSSVGSYFSATGGQNNGTNTASVGKPQAGTLTPTGGNGGMVYGSWQGGGGGAGGYTGNGGNGWYGTSINSGSANGSGGAGGGGGGYGSSTYAFAGGGGVGIRGSDGGGQLGSSVDSSQQSSPFNSGNSFYSDFRYSGPGGSGGEHGGPNSNSSVSSNVTGRTMYSGEGGNYGGGGGGAGTSMSGSSNFGRGGAGAVVIVYSTDPNFSIGTKH